MQTHWHTARIVVYMFKEHAYEFRYILRTYVEEAVHDITFTRQNATYDRSELSYLVG